MSNRKRRTFTTEFKHEAACLVVVQYYTNAEAGLSHDLSERALHQWVKQLQQKRVGKTPKSKTMSPKQKRIHKLESRVNRLKRE